MIRLCAFSDEAAESLEGQIAALKRNGIGLTAMTAANTADNGFYAQPVSVWRTKVNTLKKNLESYMKEYED